MRVRLESIPRYMTVPVILATEDNPHKTSTIVMPDGARIVCLNPKTLARMIVRLVWDAKTPPLRIEASQIVWDATVVLNGAPEAVQSESLPRITSNV